MKSLDPASFFELSAFHHSALFENCQYVWESLAKIKPYLKKAKLGQINGQVSPQAYLINPELISIGKGTIVEAGAYIAGPCIIGENCTIRHGAYIRGDLICGNNCVIGHDTEIKHSIMLDHAHAAHFAYVGDSILGNHVNLGAGTKCANLRLDNANIEISYNGQRIATGLRKLGAILGDKTQTGCNAVCNPGTLTGKGVVTHPCISFGGFIPANSSIKLEVKVSIC